MAGTKAAQETEARESDGRPALPEPVSVAISVFVPAALLALSLAAWAFGWMDQEDMEDWGYVGVFPANFVPHVSLIIPLPGMAAVGHALIIWGAEELNPVLIVIVGTVAMTGITAGALRMNFLLFTVAIGLGHFLRIVLLVVLGQELLDSVGL